MKRYGKIQKPFPVTFRDVVEIGGMILLIATLFWAVAGLLFPVYFPMEAVVQW